MTSESEDGIRKPHFHKDFKPMEILSAIGVNSTVGIQFVVFIVVYMFLSQVLFKPYFKAYVARKDRTVGNTELAERVTAEAQELEVRYEQKARAINSEYKAIYDQSRSEALKQHDQLVAKAREEATVLLEQARERIQSEVAKAHKDLSGEAPQVTQTITSKLLGKELSL